MTEAYNMDCMEGMRRYPDKYFDLAVVDPPYRDEKENAPFQQMRAQTDGSLSLAEGPMKVFGKS